MTESFTLLWNGVLTILIGLVGVIWRSLSSRLDKIEDTRISSKECDLRHAAITLSLVEIKVSQKEIQETLTLIKSDLAYNYGKENGKKDV